MAGLIIMLPCAPAFQHTCLEQGTLGGLKKLNNLIDQAGILIAL